MERDLTTIELGIASVVTEGAGGPVEDEEIGRLFAGLSDD